MAYLISDCMTSARGITNDTDATNYRVSDADYVIYANEALATIALHRPDLFSSFVEITLTASETFQSAPAGTLRLMEIIRVKNGRVVKECSHDDLDSFDVNWHSATAGVPTNWARHPRDPAKFYVSPPAANGTILIGQVAQSPAVVASNSALPIPDAYKPVIVEYMVWRAESRDDEAVSQPRAVLFLAAWKANLNVSARTKATADSDVGNRDIQRAVARQQAVAGPTGQPQQQTTSGQSDAY